MYAAIDNAMARDMTQMELYCEIGKAVCTRTEKGAAVAAAEYIKSQYSDVRGFSPRNLRRMRDFYRIYENEPKLLALTMELNWTQNVVILEADLTMEEREWYIKAACRFGWSKAELIANIADNVHENIVLTVEENECYIVEQEEKQTESEMNVVSKITNTIYKTGWRIIRRWLIWKVGRRRRDAMLWGTVLSKWLSLMRYS